MIGKFPKETRLDANSKPRWPLLTWMIIAQLLTLGSLFLWLLVAGMSFMAFDGGATAEAWTLVGLVWLYPLWPLITSVGAWFAYARRRTIRAVVLSVLSFLPPILLFLFIFIANATWFLFN